MMSCSEATVGWSPEYRRYIPARRSSALGRDVLAVACRQKKIPLHEAALSVLLSGGYSRFSSSAMAAGSSFSSSKEMPLTARKASSSLPSFSDMAIPCAVSVFICASSAA